MKIVTLVLQGKYNFEGTPDCHLTGKRIVSIDLEKENEMREIVPFLDGYGLKCDNGVWKIAEAYELMEPTVELHENRYPVGYSLTLDEFNEILDEALNKFLPF